MRKKTARQVRREFIRRGATISAWAAERGFKPNLVFNVISGRNKGVRGKSHKIAVMLGLKNGEIAT